jgi:hypothetical protein
VSRKAVQPHQITQPRVSLTAAERKAWDDEIWNIIDLADYEYCEACGKDMDRHVIVPDYSGKWPTVLCIDQQKAEW